MYLLFSCLVIEWAALERFYIRKDKLTVVLWCAQLFRQPFGEQKEIFKLLADLNCLDTCSSCAPFIRFPFVCWSVISTADSCLPRDCYKVFVKDHKSPVAKKTDLLPNSSMPYCTPCKVLRLCRQTRIKPRCSWSDTGLAHPMGLGWVFSTSCWFRLSAPKAPGCYFQMWFGGDRDCGGASTSGWGAASSVLWHFLLQRKKVP